MQESLKNSLETFLFSYETIDTSTLGDYNIYVENLSQLENSELKDVYFSVEDKKIPAHKIIISLRNDFFKALLTSGMIESQQSEIALNDLQISSINVLLGYLYCGKRKKTLLVTPKGSTKNMTPNDAVELLCTSGHIIDDRLKHVCEYLIQTGIDVDNVISIMEAAYFYSAEHLQTFCINFIIENFAQVMKTEDFKVSLSIIDLST
jgi:BTB/POZ domain-containing protein 9